MSRTPNYKLIESYSYYLRPLKTKTLDAGSWVRPVDYSYVPDHVREDERWDNFDVEKFVFVYTRQGFVMVPKRLVRES